MIWVLITHIMLGSTTELSVLQIHDRVFLRQDACEAAKLTLLQDDMKAGRPKLNLECRSMGVVE